MIIKNRKPLLTYTRTYEFVLPPECNDSLTHDVAIALLTHIVEHNEIITYSNLVKKMSIRINPRNLDHPLGTLSEACLANGLPLISVMVVNKESFFPGDGFFKWFFPELDRSKWEEKFVEEYNKVTKYTDWNRVLLAFRANGK